MAEAGLNPSGTYDFAPSTGECGLAAFARCQIHRPSLTAEHMANLRNESNFLLSEWANGGVNLWTVDLQTVPLIAGTATYTVPNNTIMILDAYIQTNPSGSSTPTDRWISPISRTEFASFPNKTLQAPPTVFWFDRLISPTITLWPVPDATSTYTLNYYRCRQIQDSTVPLGVQPEIPYLFLDAFVWGLAARLSLIHAPQLFDRLDMLATRSWAKAATANVENVNTYILPQIGIYTRN